MSEAPKANAGFASPTTIGVGDVEDKKPAFETRAQSSDGKIR
ncbi:MAG: hypothetical protein AAFR23_09285 [Pseudomonadota bacterium]